MLVIGLGRVKRRQKNGQRRGIDETDTREWSPSAREDIVRSWYTSFEKKNQNAPRPSEHIPQSGGIVFEARLLVNLPSPSSSLPHIMRSDVAFVF